MKSRWMTAVKPRTVVFCLGVVALAAIWAVVPKPGDRRSSAAQSADAVERGEMSAAEGGQPKVAPRPASVGDERANAVQVVLNAIDSAIVSAFRSDEDYDKSLGVLSRNRLLAIELLRQRYYELDPSDSATRWVVVSTAADLPCEAAASFLTEVLWSQDDLSPEVADDAGVVKLEALRGLSEFCRGAACDRQELLRDVVSGHPDIGIKRAAASMYVYGGKSQEEARDILRSQLPVELRDVVPDRVVRGAEFTPDLIKKGNR